MLAGAAIAAAVLYAATIPDPAPDPDHTASSAAEGVAADRRGNVYGGEVVLKNSRKYVPK
jgi:hypothetical protein